MSSPDAPFRDQSVGGIDVTPDTTEAARIGRSSLAADALSEFHALLTTYLARGRETQKAPTDPVAVEGGAGDDTYPLGDTYVLIALDEDGEDGLLLIETREGEE